MPTLNDITFNKVQNPNERHNQTTKDGIFRSENIKGGQGTIQ
jgi:hypothetical protein